MGASSSGLLDEAKISHVKGLVDDTFQSFGTFYRQQYSSAYFGHLHQEVEPKKEGRGLLLTQRPQYPSEEVLHQGNVRFSCWDEQGKKCRERYAVFRRDFRVEIHENVETFSRGCAPKLVLQPAGGSVLTTEEESRAHLEQICSGILNGVKEDSSSVVSSPEAFAVYLHLPYTGHTCFLFQQEEERDHFLSALKTCIRHRNLDPWCESSYESQAFVRAFRLSRQDKGRYDSWEILLGTEEQVLASQVMEEVLPWLQGQLQSRLKGKKADRIRQWLATVQATHAMVLELLTASLQALRLQCRQTALANQTLVRSNLDQIVSSRCFLEEKVRVCICEEAEKVYSESVAPYMSSILEVLTENISAGIQEMHRTLSTQMDSTLTQVDSTLTHTPGGTEETKQALFTLRSVSLDQCYRRVKNLTEILKDLKQRFGLSSAERLVHSAHLEMEQLFDSAVYTLELFLQSSARLQPSQIPVKMERAKERVLKQLDYDSRVVQRRLYQEALLEITLPALTRRMDGKWKAELQQFEQYIFSDYSSFILVHNVYDDVLRNILSKEIETVVQDAASKTSNNLSLDVSELVISQYSLLGQTPPDSAPGSPASCARRSSSAAPCEAGEPAPSVEEEEEEEEGAQTAEALPQSDDPEPEDKSEPGPAPSSGGSAAVLSPVIIVTQEINEPVTEGSSSLEETGEDVRRGADAPPATESTTSAESSKPATADSDAPAIPESTSPIPDAPEPVLISAESSNQSTAESVTAVTCEVGPPDPPTVPESTDPIPDAPELVGATAADSSNQATADSGAAVACDVASPDPPTVPESTSPVPDVPEPSVSADVPARSAESDRSDRSSPMKISLESLNAAIGGNSAAASGTQAQQTTDRAVYLTGGIKDSWVKEEKRKEAAAEERTEGGADDGEKGGEPEERKGDEEDEEEEKEEESRDQGEEVEEDKVEEELLLSPQPMESQAGSSAELPLDSVALIRELVTEVTEVEIAVGPGGDAPDSLP